MRVVVLLLLHLRMRLERINTTSVHGLMWRLLLQRPIVMNRMRLLSVVELLLLLTSHDSVAAVSIQRLTLLLLRKHSVVHGLLLLLLLLLLLGVRPRNSSSSHSHCLHRIAIVIVVHGLLLLARLSCHGRILLLTVNGLLRHHLLLLLCPVCDRRQLAQRTGHFMLLLSGLRRH